MLKEIFIAFDTDGSGGIDRSEFRNAIKAFFAL